jgi:hypothetical protein
LSQLVSALPNWSENPASLVVRNDAFKAQTSRSEPGANLKKQEKNNIRGRILGPVRFSKRCIQDTPDKRCTHRARARDLSSIMYRTKREQSQDSVARFFCPSVAICSADDVGKSVSIPVRCPHQARP